MQFLAGLLSKAKQEKLFELTLHLFYKQKYTYSYCQTVWVLAKNWDSYKSAPPQLK